MPKEKQGAMGITVREPESETSARVTLKEWMGGARRGLLA